MSGRKLLRRTAILLAALYLLIIMPIKAYRVLLAQPAGGRSDKTGKE